MANDSSTWAADELIALARRENRTVTEYPETPEAARKLIEDLGVEAADDCAVWEHVSGGGYSGSEAAGYYDVWGDDWRVHVVTAELPDDDTSRALPEDAVIVETMPEHLRGSHRAARNWGVYPHNGAERRIMSRSDAEDLCEGDEYNHIVRDAREADIANYEVS